MILPWLTEEKVLWKTAAAWDRRPAAGAEPLPPLALIDVRQPAEYRLDGRVDGSINIAAYSWEHGFHVPLDDFAATVSDEGFELDAPIALIHSMPMLATGAAQVLEAAGFTDVSIVEGGLQSWEPEALIVDDDEGLVGSWV